MGIVETSGSRECTSEIGLSRNPPPPCPLAAMAWWWRQPTHEQQIPAPEIRPKKGSAFCWNGQNCLWHSNGICHFRHNDKPQEQKEAQDSAGRCTTCSSIGAEMRQLRREVKALRRELLHLNHMITQVGSKEDEEATHEENGDSEKSFRSLPAPEAPRPAQARKGTEPAQEQGKRKQKRKKKRKTEKKPAEQQQEEEKTSESADDESAGLETCSLGTMQLRSDKEGPEIGEDQRSEDTSNDRGMNAPTPAELTEMLGQEREYSGSRKARGKGKGKGKANASHHSCGTGSGCGSRNKQWYRGPSLGVEGGW